MAGIETRLTKAIGLRWPVFQSPMAGVSSPAMAASVSNAGGLGALGIGAAPVDQARAMIRELRSATDRPFHVNVFCHAPARADSGVETAWLKRLAPLFAACGSAPPRRLSEIYTSFRADAAMQQMLLDERPPVVSFHFGLPGQDVIAALQEAGCFLMASATSLDEARAIEAAGLDAVIAQGWEAGGHRGMFDPDAEDSRLSTLELTRALAAELAIPVVAAGGLMDGADIARALAAGAAAAQLGTAFIGCPESLADAPYRSALKSEAAAATRMTAAISGRPARCLANRFTAWAEASADAAIPDYPIAYDAGKALNAAAKAAGETGFGAQWAGQGAPRARFLPAAELMGVLVEELQAAAG